MVGNGANFPIKGIGDNYATGISIYPTNMHSMELFVFLSIVGASLAFPAPGKRRFGGGQFNSGGNQQGRFGSGQQGRFGGGQQEIQGGYTGGKGMQGGYTGGQGMQGSYTNGQEGGFKGYQVGQPGWAVLGDDWGYTGQELGQFDGQESGGQDHGRMDG